MSIYEQLDGMTTEARQADNAERDAEARQAEHNLYRILSALGLEPGLCPGGVCFEEATLTQIELAGGSSAFSERTTGKGSTLSATLLVRALIPQDYAEAYAIEHGGKHPDPLFRTFTAHVQNTQNSTEDARILAESRLIFHRALSVVITERDAWVTTFINREAAPTPHADLDTLMQTLARLLQPYL